MLNRTSPIPWSVRGIYIQYKSSPGKTACDASRKAAAIADNQYRALRSDDHSLIPTEAFHHNNQMPFETDDPPTDAKDLTTNVTAQCRGCVILKNTILEFFQFNMHDNTPLTIREV
jgi:hypothetical protein